MTQEAASLPDEGEEAIPEPSAEYRETAAGIVDAISAQVLKVQTLAATEKGYTNIAPVLGGWAAGPPFPNGSWGAARRGFGKTESIDIDTARQDLPPHLQRPAYRASYSCIARAPESLDHWAKSRIDVDHVGRIWTQDYAYQLSQSSESEPPPELVPDDADALAAVKARIELAMAA